MIEMIRKRLSEQQGFTLIEAIIAMFVFAVGFLGVASMQVTAIRGNTVSKRYSEATMRAVSRIELLKKVDFDADTDANSHPDLQLGTHEEDTPEGFAMTWEVLANNDPNCGRNTARVRCINFTVRWRNPGFTYDDDEDTDDEQKLEFNFIKAQGLFI